MQRKMTRLAFARWCGKSVLALALTRSAAVESSDSREARAALPKATPLFERKARRLVRFECCVMSMALDQRWKCDCESGGSGLLVSGNGFLQIQQSAGDGSPGSKFRQIEGSDVNIPVNRFQQCFCIVGLDTVMPDFGFQ